MSDPVLHVLAGPNGAGKSTLYELVVGPATHLEFVNADEIAAVHWPDDPSGRSYDAAAVAADRRTELLGQRRSFVTETVFSHVSKLELLRAATTAGYLVTLHVVMVPEQLAVARVTSRVAAGGHAVPEQKIRERYQRLWFLIAEAITVVDTAIVYDNTRAKTPFRVVATFERGSPVGVADWPRWTPTQLKAVGG
ncbi:MAG TPA: zeta toxin family protein [Mycobacteriales bacterium]|nr:zeta toxin family protein [Mycobacteriales bacterium]